MSSKDRILNKLRLAQQPFTEIPPVENRQKMVNLAGSSPDAMKARFIEEAEKLSCYVYPVEDEQEAINKVIALVDAEKQVLAWDDDKLPFPLKEHLSKNEITIAGYNDSKTLVGITGVDGALAGTGSLIVSSGKGKHRSTSLLPDKHIALVKTSQILPDFETWIQTQQETGQTAFKDSSNTVVITGPSKTADIAQELIKGAHGPRQVNIILIE